MEHRSGGRRGRGTGVSGRAAGGVRPEEGEGKGQRTGEGGAPWVPILILALAGLAVGAGCARPVPPEVGDAERLAEELMEADRAFHRATVERGADGWASWFAAEGAMIQPGVGEIAGREAVRAFMAPGFADPEARLDWEPERADVAASGDLGWTTGRFEARGTGPDGEVRVTIGRYVSVWRRQEDGSWKVVMDLGNPTDTRDAPQP